MSAHLEIDEKDRSLLLHVLNEKLESLDEEILHTDTRAYREELKVDRAGLQNLIEKLSGDTGRGAVAAAR